MSTYFKFSVLAIFASICFVCIGAFIDAILSKKPFSDRLKSWLSALFLGSTEGLILIFLLIAAVVIGLNKQ